MEVIKSCPETCIIFVTFGRKDVSKLSFESLQKSLKPYRDKVKIILSDATDDTEKMLWAKDSSADDVILTPRFTPAATSRNIATSLALDKYSPKFLCMIEDDFEYHPDWYPKIVEATDKFYGVRSPFDLAYGVFSASEHHVPSERIREDHDNGLKAYIFGAVAYQRFMLTSHYLSVMKCWDSDLLGISYAQTGGQTFRNTMRGFCGGILPGKLSWPIDEKGLQSTWSKGKRDPGPPAHSFCLDDYNAIRFAAKKTGYFEK